MSWPFLIVGLIVGAAIASNASEQSNARVANVPKLPKPRPFKRIASERRICEEQTQEDDDGLVRKATLYTPCDWQPLPWMLSVWTNEVEDTEVFALTPHPNAAGADLRVSVVWSDAWQPGYTSDSTKEVYRDERFANRLIFDYVESIGGAFLIDIRVQGERVRFFHRPRRPRMLVLRKTLPSAVPSPAPPNPFEERLAGFIRLQEQYESAKKQALGRGLPKGIEDAALQELERVFQDEVMKLEEGGSDGR